MGYHHRQDLYAELKINHLVTRRTWPTKHRRPPVTGTKVISRTVNQALIRICYGRWVLQWAEQLILKVFFVRDYKTGGDCSLHWLPLRWLHDGRNSRASNQNKNIGVWPLPWHHNWPLTYFAQNSFSEFFDSSFLPPRPKINLSKLDQGSTLIKRPDLESVLVGKP